jgi:large subunit ribosomal protein L21
MKIQAVIELKGKQHLVEEGMVIRTLRIEGEVGSEVKVERVLAVIDGEKIEVGHPVLENRKVNLSIVRHAKSPKIHILTYQPKKRTVRRSGYRDKITYLRVQEIGG